MRGNVGLTKVVVLMFMAPDRRQATLAFGWDTAKPKGGVRKSSVRFPSEKIFEAFDKVLDALSAFQSKS